MIISDRNICASCRYLESQVAQNYRLARNSSKVVHHIGHWLFRQRLFLRGRGRDGAWRFSVEERSSPAQASAPPIYRTGWKYISQIASKTASGIPFCSCKNLHCRAVPGNMRTWQRHRRKTRSLSISGGSMEGVVPSKKHSSVLWK